ncbi:MarR family winged helix-turn-helix transcriptional regulator [Agrilactobacillus fermenti]|uniref:MarR family winged helix-turn-helix transcriptional regulator n=1 Tax=Agrilactobacillus fermenti TaxID=2586909 RepID=UPI001E382CA6|nr:MarR family transcriptional regulator [Agrilactobacillus fermenti]MCD2257173.1 MarR family transcriptional regulator [Agrilactobacillus fermenti]
MSTIKDEPDALMAQISRTARHIQMNLDKVLRPLNLNASNYYFILKVGQHQGQLSQDELYQLLDIDASNITRRLKQLVDLGYVTKIRNPDDKRSWVVSLTSEGQAVYQRLVPVLTQVSDQITTDLTGTQMTTLKAALYQISERLI